MRDHSPAGKIAEKCGGGGGLWSQKPQKATAAGKPSAENVAGSEGLEPPTLRFEA